MDTLRRRIFVAAPVTAVAAKSNAAFVDAAAEIDGLLDRFFAAYTAMDVDALVALLTSTWRSRTRRSASAATAAARCGR